MRLLKWTAGLGCLGMIGVMALLSLMMNAAEKQGIHLAPPKPETPSAPSLHPGDIAMVGRHGEKNFYLAVDDKTWGEMIDAQNNRDREGLALMIAEGRVLLIDGGTRCRIVKAGVTSFQVRPLDGTSGPAPAGWIQRELVHPWEEPVREGPGS
jgi:hypothetical protein